MFGIKSSSDEPDAIELLKADHHEVDAMFKEYETLQKNGTTTARKTLVTRICNALTVHATMEEEIFYPAARRAGSVDKRLVDEAAVEHQTLKDIIARLQAAPVADPLYDAGVKVLGEYTHHHVKEEENELFPQMKKSGEDLVELGRRLQARKEALEASRSHGSKASAKRSADTASQPRA
ncbi:MAG TPA: hemerythrin domain-containing protein [Casimicrobiaceae bacterium]|jgi:hemerythrin superfamily protein|nr:hemerythrin domain-containing protein [Casimicrobiaceae bacterium]